MKLYNNPADPQLENLWKMCGRDTEAGRIMYKFYGSHYKPDLKYPKVRTKSTAQLQQEKLTKTATKKPCPQRAKVDYPSLKPQPEKTNDAIRYVPKRKSKAVIDKEMAEMRRVPMLPPQPGQDRARMIDELQEKYQFSTGILPKSVQPTAMNFDNKTMTAMKGSMSKGGRFAGGKKPPVPVPEEKKGDELDELFDSIIKEIEERQEHLEAVMKTGKDERTEAIEKRIKGEIASRVSELQRIAELKKKAAAK